MKKSKVKLPEEFDFKVNVSFLKRSPKELLHYVEEDVVTKFLRIGGSDFIFSITANEGFLDLVFLLGDPNEKQKKEVERYVAEWFDLNTNLKPFYALAERDKILKDLVTTYYGYRIIGQPDLFESLVWAILGQQINLTFAYTLKQRFVERFGDRIIFNDRSYYLFPKPERVAELNDMHLLPLQFSRQKSKYVVTIAEAFVSKSMTKEKLSTLNFEEAKQQLMKINGIGNWTANYALMKTFRYPNAFPLEDAGIHNAIKSLKGMNRKPTLEEVKRIFKRYKGWEAYATLYLWKSLG